MRDLILITVVVLFIAFVFSLANKESDVDNNGKENVNLTSNNTAAPEQANRQQPNRELPKRNSVTNLLKNGDFEQSLNDWTYEEGAFWSDNGGQAVDGQNASAGLLMNAPQIQSDSRRIYSKSVDQCVALNGGSEFAIQADVRYLNGLPERPSVNRINVYWYESLDCKRGGQFGRYAEPRLEKQRWQTVSRQGLRPALGAKAARIEIIQSQRGNNNAEVIWDNVVFSLTSTDVSGDSNNDDISVHTKPLGENYVLNPGFDDDLEHWLPKRAKRLVWRESSDEMGGVMQAGLLNERDGGVGRGSFSQCVNIGTHSRFELGARVKISSLSTEQGGGRLRPTWYEHLDCEGRHTTSSKHADIDKMSFDWQLLSVGGLKPKHGAKSVRISMIHSIKGRGEHIMFWDDVYFKAY